MKNKFCCIIAIVGTLLITAAEGFSYESLGIKVNTACAPATPFTGSCLLCHTSGSKGQNTPAQTAYKAGGSKLTDFFCPPVVPTCTDNDNDSYSLEGGDCGPVDCNDSNAAIKPGATENCNDNIDNNCNGLIDFQDPAAIGCLVCTDSDGDSFAIEGGDCGQVDCNDQVAGINPDATDRPNNGIDEDCSGKDSVDPTRLDNDGDGYTQITGDCDDNDAAINPGSFDIPNNGLDENCDGVDSIDMTTVDNDGDGFTPAAGDCDDTDGTINPDAVENCTDGTDNNCNGLVDALDPNAANCPINCIDNDGDGYAVDGGECGTMDCNDYDAAINPGMEEICEDGIDNDCDGSIDEGCDITCQDADGDGYQNAFCGGDDCNDYDPTINPSSAEVCGNEVDENCNGASDDICLTCPDGTLLVIKKVKYSRGDKKLKIKGRATVGTTISILNADTGEILIEGVKVRKGKWKARIKHVSSNLQNITAVSSNGCALDQAVERKRCGNNDDDDDHDDRKERKRKHKDHHERSRR
ncbi:MAG: putative metal-binding motif-containing protein [Desulforhopalus sp.]